MRFWLAVPLFGVPLSVMGADPDAFNARDIDRAIRDKNWPLAVERSVSECERVYGKKADDPKATSAERRRAAIAHVECLEKEQSRVSLHAASAGVSGLGHSYAQDLGKAKVKAVKRVSEDEYKGWNFGVGIGFSRGRGERIDEAQVVNNVVTVTSRRKQQARIFGEAHYFPEGWCNRDPLNVKYGCGPFLVIAPSEQSILGAGFGFMFGVKTDAEKKEGWSIGVGLILDNDVKELASGFEEGKAPPAGQTTVLTEKKARWSNVFFITRTF